MNPRPINVVFLAYPGVSLLDLSGPLEALRIASTYPGSVSTPPLYACSVLSAEGGPVMTSDGVALVTDALAAYEGRQIDTLIVPGALYVDDVARDPVLVDWVRRRAPECRRVCSVCAGTFLLAAAGVLSGRRAVTHWAHCARLSKAHPDIQVEPDAIYVRDDAVWTSAGVTTGIDLALALIEDDLDRKVAMHVARVLVVYLRRPGGQSQYSALLASQVEGADDSFAALERWIAENPTADLRVDRLAEKVNMSPRNFARRYRERRGRTPSQAVEAIRVDAARRLLEQSDARMAQVATLCGFSDEEHLRVAFGRQVGVSPRKYRERFSLMS